MLGVRSLGSLRSMNPLIGLLALLLPALALHAAAAQGAPMPLSLSSAAFAHQSEIPIRYTCEAQSKPELSVPLHWSGVPAGAKSLALIVDDPDAPGGTWTHWVLYDLPPAVTDLAEGMTSRALPLGTREGVNSWSRIGYGGPCPPAGRHRYVFKLYALDVVLPDLRRPTAEQLEQAMEGHIRAHAELIGTYQQRGR